MNYISSFRIGFVILSGIARIVMRGPAASIPKQIISICLILMLIVIVAARTVPVIKHFRGAVRHKLQARHKLTKELSIQRGRKSAAPTTLQITEFQWLSIVWAKIQI